MLRKALVIAVSLLCICLLYTAPLKSVSVKATLTSIVGDVQVQPSDGSWTPAKEGMLVASGSQIKTGAKSSVVVRWSTQNMIKLTQFTFFTVKDINVDPKTKTVTSSGDLFMGKVKAKAEKLQNPQSSFEITTPTAVAGVRGTAFDMENTADNTTNVSCYDGSVDVTAQGQTQNVPAGTEVSIPAGSAPPEPTPMSDEDKHACEVDDDCWSHKCVDGKCENEDAAREAGGACAADAEACEKNNDCCSNNCENGLCQQKAAAAVACLEDGEACAADEECCSEDCVDGVCAAKEEEEEEEEALTLEITSPVSDERFPLEGETVSVSGKTLAGAMCNVNGNVVTAGDDGSFTVSISLEAGGDLELKATCADEKGNSVEEAVTVYVKAPPTLLITSPSSGFTDCPYVNISGMVEPGSQVIMNGDLILSLEGAQSYSDGSFSIDNLRLQDCTLPLIFQAKDEFGQITKEDVYPGSVSADSLGLVFTGADVMVIPSGQWVYGMTEVQVRAVVRSSTPIPVGLVASLYNLTEGGTFIGSAPLVPIGGIAANAVTGEERRNRRQTREELNREGDYYAVAEGHFMYGEANPLTVKAVIGGFESEPISVVLKAPVCISSAAMTEGDGIDNDCDGLVDEEINDGIDNDGDLKVDEDLICDFADSAKDCDKDGVANGSDCNPFDAMMNLSSDDPNCKVDIAHSGVIPGDNIDNDGDWRVDEEFIDGIDNDGDGQVDEDTTMQCDFGDPGADCDYDAVVNGDDCNPFDPYVTTLATDPACGASCDPFGNPDGDCDKDGMTNGQELAMGTDPFSRDADGDGYPDDYEMMYGYNPNDPNSYPQSVTDMALNCPPGSYVDYLTGTCVYACPPGYITDPATGACICQPGTYMDPITGYCREAENWCPGGQYMADDGTCACPTGTVWDYQYQVCKVPDMYMCERGTYFDYSIGSCVTECTGGQTADPITGTCYCANGFMDYATMKCTSSYACPGGFVAIEGQCLCPSRDVLDALGDTTTTPAPYYDMFKNTCVAECSGGQIGDPFYGFCNCPPGTYQDWATMSCIQAGGTSACANYVTDATCMTDPSCYWDWTNYACYQVGMNICPFGSHGSGCDASVKGDCDMDGMMNYEDPQPCYIGGCEMYVTEPTCMIDPKCKWDMATMRCMQAVSGFVCPPDTNGAGCDLSDPMSDCDNDGAQNMYDACPCRFGTPADGYCPAAPTSCPAGMYVDPIAGTCVAACTPGSIADPATGACICAPGTYPDPATGYCMSGCPSGMVLDPTLGCVCPQATPYLDSFTNQCVATCSGGQVPAVDWPGCTCPVGTYYDFATAYCITMPGCDVRPRYDGCGCTTNADCMSNFCDKTYGGMCMPAMMGCNNNAMCEPWYSEDSIGCPADCRCGDMVCDNYEASTMMCPGDCGGTRCDTGCDYSVMYGDCDQDGITNMNDMNPCYPDTTVCPAGTEGAGCNQFDPYGDCDIDTVPNMNDGCPCTYGSPTMGGCPGGGGCEMYVTEPTCYTDPNCYWDYAMMRCMFAGGTTCAYRPFPDGCPCTAAADCMSAICSMSTFTCGTGNIAGCEMYVTEPMCMTDYNCRWDYTTMKCVLAGGDICSPNVTEATCITNPGCFWDMATMKCIYVSGGCPTRPFADGCPCTVSADCMSGICDYASYTCMPMGGGCTAYVTEPTCTTNPNCYWDMATMMCYQGGAVNCGYNGYCDIQQGEDSQGCPTDCWCGDGQCDSYEASTNTCPGDCGGSNCSGFVSEAGCMTDPNCYWDMATMMCMQSGGTNCANYVTEPTCITDPNCYWDMATMMCYQGGGCTTKPYPDGCACASAADCMSAICDMTTYTCGTGGGGCSVYVTEPTCITDPNCYWDMATMMCYQGGGCTTPPYPDGCACATNPDCASNYCNTSTWICETGGTNCASYVTEPTCTTDPNCYWDFEMNMCYQGSGCNNNGICEPGMGETSANCPADCWDCNNNTICDTSNGENSTVCPADCGGSNCSSYVTEPTCTIDPNCYWNIGAMMCYQSTCDNNVICDTGMGESPASCPSDCWDCNNNTICDTSNGENSTVCPADCGGGPNCTITPYDDTCPCTMPSECSSTFCNANVCGPDPCMEPSNRPDGCACTSTSECASTFCNANVCGPDPCMEPSNRPDGCACASPSECASTFCNVGICGPDPCMEPSNRPDGCACTSPPECASTFCNANVCGPDPCTQPNNRPLGCACTSNLECASNVCDTVTTFTCQ
ncbi:MAG: FecR domain-containing protein [bacterium]